MAEGYGKIYESTWWGDTTNSIYWGSVYADLAGGGFTGLLDTYSGAAAAYSLRQLSSSYSGNAVRVRRASDNTEQDIGFANNELDTTSLETFCSGTNGFVTTWYDQSGNGVNLTQSTASDQSQIVSSGSAILEGGKPCLDYNIDEYSSSYEMSDDSSFLISMVFRVDVQKDSNPRYLGLVSSTINLQVGHNGDSKYFIRKDSVTNTSDNAYTTTGSRNLLSWGASSDSLYFGLNGSNVGFTGTGAPTADSNRNNGITLFKGYTTSSFYAQEGNIQELIIYEADESTNRTGIETNINTHYSIY